MNKYTFFWDNTPFSQWHICNFKLEDINFNCAEQYMMYKKATLFEDHISANLILNSENPKDQKRLGRSVLGYNQDSWDEQKVQIVYRGNHAKFTQNIDLYEKLIQTRGTVLVEASPLDRIWGIGLSADDSRARNEKTWLGLNLLGKVLTQLRDNLIKSKNL